MSVMYSTPYKYLKALEEQEIVWPNRYNDMFPYADSVNDYWTGYFTSRANSKAQIRQTQRNLHAASRFYSNKSVD